MTQHTPGPWEVDRDNNGIYRLIDFSDLADEAYNSDDAQSAIAINKEDKANAELIAKAWLIPELVEACKVAREFMEAIELVSEVLAKVKGE